MKKKTSNFIIYIICLLLIAPFFPSLALASQFQEPTKIVELLSAGVFSKGTYAIESNFFKSNGLRLALDFAPFSNLNIGVSFGGTNIIGSSSITFQELPAVTIKFRFLDEKLNFPALAIGVSTQGFGPYYTGLKRFETFSPGVFLVGSKAFKNIIGIFDVHLGANYSFEPKPSARSVNFYLGMCQTMFDYFRVNIEYNANLDEHTKEIMKSKGLLNFSIDISLAQNVKFGLIFKDLLGNIQNQDKPERNISIGYTGRF